MKHNTQAPICKDSTVPLTELMSVLRAENLGFWLQPVADEFQGEYPPPSAQRLTFLTGFTGSAGFGVFRAGSGKHALFVDGRYTLQAAREVDGALFDIVNSGDVTLGQWLESETGKPVTIGFDPWLVTEQQISGWKKAVAALPVTFKPVNPNPVDGLWEARPPLPEGAITLHPIELAGASYEQKRDGLLAAMKKSRADALVITMPDAVNWLLNIRGGDIAYNPLFLCYFVLDATGKATLYSFKRAFMPEVRTQFEANGITWCDIADIFDGKGKLFTQGTRVMVDPALSAHGWWIRAEKEDWEIVSADDPSQLAKACKNGVELESVRDAHRRDGLAVSRFLHWFDRKLEHGSCDELEVVEKLEHFRRLDSGYLGGSFPTIAGAGPNGAIVHYRATAETNRKTRAGELFLLDSGGQYAGGTTDITRTLFVPAPKGGKPSATMRDHFTRVLKGHIALASAIFPEGTAGTQLDALARQYLWQAGLDYDHGTGHGVGAYLCVHEGPQRISKKGSFVALKEGMILSNEPGFYQEGGYGIRIENLVVVKQVSESTYGKKMLGFETITLAPIDTRLVDVSMLIADERNWLNDYHQRVYKAHVSSCSRVSRASTDPRDKPEDDEFLRWLAAATRAI